MVIVEKGMVEAIEVAEPDEFIRRNNSHCQRLIIIGGTGQAGKFSALPWDHVTFPNPGELEWRELEIDQKERNTGFRGYPAVFCEASLRWLMAGGPVFVNKVVLSLQKYDLAYHLQQTIEHKGRIIKSWI